jgi:hypothetical protein
MSLANQIQNYQQRNKISETRGFPSPLFNGFGFVRLAMNDRALSGRSPRGLSYRDFEAFQFHGDLKNRVGMN